MQKSYVILTHIWTLLLHTKKKSGWNHRSRHCTTYNGMLHNFSLLKIQNIYRNMCIKVNISNLNMGKKLMYPLVFHNSFWLFVILREHYFSSLAPACHYCVDLRICQGLTFNKTSLVSSIIRYIHFSFPQPLKQNHFAVTSHAFSVTFFLLEFIQWICFYLFQFFLTK